MFDQQKINTFNRNYPQWCVAIENYYKSLTPRQRNKWVRRINYEIEQLVDRYMSELSAANISINVYGTNIFVFIDKIDDFVRNNNSVNDRIIARWKYYSRPIDKWKYELYVCTMCQ